MNVIRHVIIGVPLQLRDCYRLKATELLQIQHGMSFRHTIHSPSRRYVISIQALPKAPLFSPVRSSVARKREHVTKK